MKRLAALLATALAAAALSADENVFTNYYDWQWVGNQPQAEPGTNIFSEIRYQMDFTYPIHGPWLFDQKEDAISIGCVMRARCAAAVDYRELGTTNAWTRFWQTKHGNLDNTSPYHRFDLTGLKPATAYEYRLVDVMSSEDQPALFTRVTVGKETYTFRTLDRSLANYRALLVGQLHGKGNVLLEPLVHNCGAENAEMHFMLGNDVAQRLMYAEYGLTSGWLDDACRLWARTNATFALRCNNEHIGRESLRWGDYLGGTDNKGYFSRRVGPVLWIGLDTFPWSHSSASHTAFAQEYLREQARWIEALKETDDWKGAAFRVVLAGNPTVAANNAKHYAPVFEKALNGTNAADCVHLYVALNTMPFPSYFRVDGGSQQMKNDADTPPKGIKPFRNTANYTEVLCGIHEGITIDVAPDKLTFTCHRWDLGADVAPRDAFSIAPDGTVTDIAEVHEHPCDPRAKKTKK